MSLPQPTSGFVLYPRPTAAPTFGRIPSLDVARGIAILGILLANIHAFTSLDFGFMTGQYLPVSSSLDEWLNVGMIATVVAKMRSMLAILFGVGLYMQFESRSAKGTWPGSYLKRTALLAAIGLIHGLLIWLGDILFMYSFMAFLACWFVKVRTRWLAIIGGSLAGLSLLAATLLVVVAFSPSVSPSNMFGEPETLAKQEVVYASGTYLQQVSQRVDYFLKGLPGTVLMSILMLPLFFVGIVLARTRALAQPSKHPQIRKAALWLGLGAGIPLNLLAVFLPFVKHKNFLTNAFEVFFGPVLALGLLMSIAIWVESGGAATLARTLAAVGRTALSCYLLQSILCTFFFYSIGLGWFGKLSAPQLLLVVGFVWVIVVAWANLWLTTFAMGPIEWAWRSLTEGRALPFRKVSEADLGAPQIEAA